MAPNDDKNRIRPCAANPFYWQYRGEPVLLLGGSVTDNLYQIRDIEEHLDLLKSVGGNYVRCTMHGRNPGDLRAFGRAPASGLYDLNQPGEEHWERFARFLELTAARDIVVQIEVWATWTFYGDYWAEQPFNPKNNTNYTAEESGLPESIDYGPWQRIQPFFRSVPDLDDNEPLRRYQEAFVDRLLSYSLQYGHVLYCMDNETDTDPEWGWYWARYIRDKAAQQGLHVETTEMWNKWDITEGANERVRRATFPTPLWDRPQHTYTLDYPDIYTFLELSQNNQQIGQAHYDNILIVRQRVLDSGRVRPMNAVKCYGAEERGGGPPVEGPQRGWRNLFAGLASHRFHRPPHGIGLSPLAQAHLRSMRMLSDELDILHCEPHNDLLGERAENEAYCLANPGKEYAVCFMDGGEVTLDCSGVPGQVTVRWLDVMQSAWREAPSVPAGSAVRLSAPGDGIWAALVRPG